MGTFSLTFKTDNAAFSDDDAEAEIARILRKAADRVEAGDVTGRCMDVNGNGVGSWKVTP